MGKDKKYDRLGSDDAMVEIANVDVPQIRIPVKTGRNVAIIIEVAAMNFRAKQWAMMQQKRSKSA